MRLQYPAEWRFALDGDTHPIHPPLISRVHQQLVQIASGASDRQSIIEAFKEEFASAGGTAFGESSSLDWAISDLRSAMDRAARNGALFIDAYWSALQQASARGLACPTIEIVNGLLAVEGSSFEIRPPHLLIRASTGAAQPKPTERITKQSRALAESPADEVSNDAGTAQQPEPAERQSPLLLGESDIAHVSELGAMAVIRHGNMNKAQLQHILTARDTLRNLDPYPWTNVTTVVASLVPLIRHAFPDHVAAFDDARKEPQWLVLPRVISGGGTWDTTSRRDNFASAAATEERHNRQAAARARDELVAFLDGLLLLVDTQPDPLQHSNGGPTADKKGKTMKTRPRIFIGSSTEGLEVAKLLQLEMDYEAEVSLWSQGVFGLSGGTLETLVRISHDFDFAVLVLTPDDVVNKRDVSRNAPRDNVLFELGLFIGTLGRERTYIVHPRVPIDLPSDLAGITPATYEPNRADGNLHSAIGPAATRILAEVKKLGRRSRAGE